MKLNVLNLTKTEIGKKDLPVQFREEVREDLIKKAVVVIQANKRQPYGADPKAGLRASAQISKRRRKYRGCYGHGISRTPRKIMSRRGTNMNWTGAVAPNTVGGRRAHAPKAEKVWKQKINKKEKRKAIRSALSATVIPAIVEKRGHKVPKEYPFIIEDKFESLNKAKEIKDVLMKIGLKEDLERSEQKTVRAGRGTMRGRKYKKKKGPLLVVSKKCNALKASQNIPGVDIVEVKNLNSELLAPGTAVGRLTIFTNSAMELMEKEKLFM